MKGATWRRLRGAWGMIALLAAACGGPQPSLPQPRATAPAGAPSGSLVASPASTLGAVLARIAFSRDTGPGLEDVFILDLPGGVERMITDGRGRAFDPDISPDGTRIVFRRNPDPGSDRADLWLVDADGGRPRNLTNDPAANNWSPAWSPDGRRIAFASSRDAGIPRLWSMAPDGADGTLVTTGHGEYPDWSPDGTHLVYAAPAGGGTYELWVIDALGGGAPLQLTHTPTTEFGPAWSPDGAWIAYQFDTGARWEVWLIHPDGSEAHRVSDAGLDGAWPAWLPSGLLAWDGPGGLQLLDVERGARGQLPMRGTTFLSAAASAPVPAASAPGP